MKKEWNGLRILKIIGAVISVLIGLMFLVMIGVVFVGFVQGISGSDRVDGIHSGNVAVIPVKGVIVTEPSGGFYDQGNAVSSELVKFIKQASEDSSIKAIVLDIDSPGGSPVASDEIATALKKANKTTVSVIHELGASGAYFVASATNKIYANRLSWVGSIGVIGSYVEYAGLMKQYNLTYRRLVAGKYKDAGSPLKEMTPEEQALFQSELNKVYDVFVDEVATNRNLSREKVLELATGFVYLGTEAKELGLIDKVGTLDDAYADLEKELNITVEPIPYEHTPSIFDFFGKIMSQSFFHIGQGIGTSITELQERPQSIKMHA